MWQNFWNLRVNDRLTQWKEFRQQLDRMPFESAIHELNEMWSTAPIVNHNLEPGELKNWPDPWQLLAENYWCDVAKALGIIYTIYFTSHNNKAMEMRVYYDYKDKERYSLVWLDGGKYILNYRPYEIVNTKDIKKKEEDMKLLYRYSKEELQLNKY